VVLAEEDSAVAVAADSEALAEEDSAVVVPVVDGNQH
jgi:hypothetical protein